MKIDGPGSAGKLSSAKKTAKSAKPAGAGFARALGDTSAAGGQADETPALPSKVMKNVTSPATTMKMPKLPERPLT
jgi:hypothetical protein